MDDIKNKLSIWAKLAHGTNQQYGGPLICALSMVHVKSDKIWYTVEKNNNHRAHHAEIRSQQVGRVK